MLILFLRYLFIKSGIINNVKNFLPKLKTSALEISLVAISIIGILIIASVMAINTTRMNSRDAVRVKNIITIRRALALYLEDSVNGYPASTGECLRADSGVGAELKASKVIAALPTDPLWPTTPPEFVFGGVAVSPANNFCYYYTSLVSDRFIINFFLESNSKAGKTGIYIATE